MSYVDLDEHPRKLELITLSFTLRSGISDGETMLEVNPAVIKRAKERRQTLEAAYK